ncbi:hypothetical protein SEA_BIRTHDAYBOY_32 [Gordonia phage BirthdayBoy]|uniref:Glycine-rich domain-containing protein n=2 Tax=Lambovirus TaxID=2843412 RepID=A0AA96GRD1_9CAUD|nr:hypothetical protein SEA_BIRTHDAYBOY_32 [Gordonia phage BirthdayBoy]WNO26254.1 hypothetical protein SEA_GOATIFICATION_32 [Gordonia phage GOATification]WNO27146.1 hypothetical protein SEA_FULCRUM_32 [Gordonia phage Fulcrum]
MAEPIETGSRINSGAYSLAVPSWADVIDYVIVGGGGPGSDGGTWTSGADGADGEVVSGSVRVRPGSTLACSVATNSASSNTTINFTAYTVSSSTGPSKSSNIVNVSPVIEGDPASGAWACDIGSRGNGGAGGSSGSGDAANAGSGQPGNGGGLFWRFRKAAQVPRLGTKRAQDIYIGTKKVEAIYIGTKKVWDKSVN